LGVCACVFVFVPLVFVQWRGGMARMPEAEQPVRRSSRRAAAEGVKRLTQVGDASVAAAAAAAVAALPV